MQLSQGDHRLAMRNKTILTILIISLQTGRFLMLCHNPTFNSTSVHSPKYNANRFVSKASAAPPAKHASGSKLP